MARDLRIVLLDIESIPDLREALRAWPQLSNYPGQTLRASVNSVLCVGWKVLGSKRVHCINAWDYPEFNKDINDDRQVVVAALDVISGADVLVTHNGSRFDLKFLQSRLLKHKLGPMPKIVHVDTCQESKRHLFPLNNGACPCSREISGHGCSPDGREN